MRRTGQLLLFAFFTSVWLPANLAAQGNGDLDEVETGAYRVGSGDVLNIEVYDDQDLSGLVTVQHGGEISFPLLGDVIVAGLSTKEITQKLTELLAKDYLVDPQVIVRVKEHRSQWVTLVGEIARPGKYYLQGTKTLLDAMTEAGGFTPKASGELLISRTPRMVDSDDEGNPSVFRIELSPEQSASEQKEALAMLLQDGDIITAPGTQVFFVSGEVRNPGSYPLNAGTTVLKAISLAGGLSKFGGSGKVEILRKRASGGTERIKVDLGDIEDGKKPDVPLKADDIVKVGKRVF